MGMAFVHFGICAVAFGLTICIVISSIKHTGVATHPKEKVLEEDDVIALETTMRLDGCSVEEALLVVRATITGALPVKEVACKADAKPQDMPLVEVVGCSDQSSYCLSHGWLDHIITPRICACV